MNKKKQVSLVKPKPQLSQIKSKIVSRIKSKNVTSETAAYDRASFRYLMKRWAVSWSSGAVIAVIVTFAEMHGIVDADIDVDVAIA